MPRRIHAQIRASNNRGHRIRNRSRGSCAHANRREYFTDGFTTSSIKFH